MDTRRAAITIQMVDRTIIMVVADEVDSAALQGEAAVDAVVVVDEAVEVVPPVGEVAVVVDVAVVVITTTTIVMEAAVVAVDVLVIEENEIKLPVVVELLKANQQQTPFINSLINCVKCAM